MILFVYPLLNDSISGEDPLSQVDPLGKNLVAVDILLLYPLLENPLWGEDPLGRVNPRGKISLL